MAFIIFPANLFKYATEKDFQQCQSAHLSIKPRDLNDYKCRVDRSIMIIVIISFSK